MDQEPTAVEYRGVMYRRNPDSDQRAHRVYYTVRRGDGRGVLHRDIYADHWGQIPEGWHVHHRDHNPFNNDPTNLQALSPADHHEIHPGSHDLTSAEWLAHLEAIRPLAAAWHSSPEGLAWHRQNGAASWENRIPNVIEQRCAQCSGPVETYRAGGELRFCSRRCINAYTDTSGRYDKEADCPICGAGFMQRRGRPMTCGSKCGTRLSWITRKGSRE